MIGAVCGSEKIKNAAQSVPTIRNAIVPCSIIAKFSVWQCGAERIVLFLDVGRLLMELAFRCRELRSQIVTLWAAVPAAIKSDAAAMSKLAQELGRHGIAGARFRMGTLDKTSRRAVLFGEISDSLPETHRFGLAFSGAALSPLWQTRAVWECLGLHLGAPSFSHGKQAAG